MVKVIPVLWLVVGMLSSSWLLNIDRLMILK